MIFLSAGLKYQDVIVSTKSNKEGISSTSGSVKAMCENKAPVIIKKKPA
jgi:hypothetical protein